MDVDRLSSIAQQLAGRVRDDDPAANQRWLHAVTTADEREALLYLLAAAVPVDRPWSWLTAWTLDRDPHRVERRRAQWREAQKRKKQRREEQAA